MKMDFSKKLPFSLEKPISEKICQIVFPVIKMSNKNPLIMKNVDNEKITKNITNCCFQVFCLEITKK